MLEAGHGTKLELLPEIARDEVLLKRDQPTKAEHTALTFEVDDIDREGAELDGRGVRFED